MVLLPDTVGEGFNLCVDHLVGLIARQSGFKSHVARSIDDHETWPSIRANPSGSSFNNVRWEEVILA